MCPQDSNYRIFGILTFKLWFMSIYIELFQLKYTQDTCHKMNKFYAISNNQLMVIRLESILIIRSLISKMDSIHLMISFLL